MTRTETPLLAAVGAVVAVLVAGPIARAAPGAAPPATPVPCDLGDRKSVSVTIYNSHVALVRELRTVRLAKPGRANIAFTEISPSIIPASVTVAVKPQPNAVRVLEQTYRYDILSPRGLAQAADGAALSIHRVDPGSGEIKTVRAQALASFSGQGDAPVVRSPEGITFYGSFQSLGFDKLPDRWSSHPSLAWLVDVRAMGTADLDVAYLTRNMDWAADYVLTLPRNPAEHASLHGWITLSNRSGISFDSAHVAVVAGRVHITPDLTRNVVLAGALAETTAAKDEAAKAVRSSLAEYYLYDLPGATQLPDQSSKQVAFLPSASVHVRTRYLANTQQKWRSADLVRGTTVTEPANLELQFDLTQAEGLGVPMPAGTVRVFAPDSHNDVKLVGDCAVEHTPRDETVKLAVGVTSDVSLTRALIDRTRTFGHRRDRVSYRLTNPHPTEISVEVHDNQGELVSANQPATHPDAATTVFNVRVPAHGQVRWQAEFQERL